MTRKTAEEIVDSIIADLQKDRVGISWDDVEDETRKEIRKSWIAIVLRVSGPLTVAEFKDRLSAMGFTRPYVGGVDAVRQRGEITVLINPHHALISGTEHWKPFRDVLDELKRL